MSASSRSFVWLYLRMEESDFSDFQRVVVSGEALQEFTEEILFNSSGVAGAPEERFATTKVSIKLIDPVWTYWETLFILNRVFFYEYGWIGDDGSVISTSGRIRTELNHLNSNFSIQGTEVEVIGSGSLSSSMGSGLENIDFGSKVMSRTFIPFDKFTKVLSGNYYNDKHPIVSILHSPPPIPANTTSLAQGTPVRSLVFSTEQGNVSVSEANAVAAFGPRYQLPENAVPYTSISALVKTYASILGLKADVDETKPATSELTVTNKTVEWFLRNRLTELAETPEGRKNFQCWIRGDTIYFKSVHTERDVKRVLRYGGDNRPMESLAPFSKDSIDTAILSFSLDIGRANMIASAGSHTVAISVDPVAKIARGGSAIAPFEASKEDIAERYRHTKDVFGKFVPKSTYKPKEKAPDLALETAENYLIWQEAGDLAKDVLSDGTDKLSAKQFEENGYQTQAFYSLLNEVRNNQRNLENAVPGAALTQPDTDIARNLAKDAPVTRRRNSSDTNAGRLYVLPHQNEQTAHFSEDIQSRSALSRLFAGKATIPGDPGIVALSLVVVDIALPNGEKHYGSGNYLVWGISHKIDGAGFTTELDLRSTGLGPSGPKELQAVQKKAENYTGFKMPPYEAPKRDSIGHFTVTVEDIPFDVHTWDSKK